MENLTNSTIDNGTLELENSALKHLDETRKWTLFLSILGFVFIGLMFVVAIIMAIVGSSNAIPGLSAAMLDRLMLNQSRLEGIAKDVLAVAALPDPVGEMFDVRTLSNGLIIGRKRVPLGVIGSIYESRPNVTIDISVLCLKSGNAVVLRGGKETIHSNTILAKVVQDAGPQFGGDPAHGLHGLVEQLAHGSSPLLQLRRVTAGMAQDAGRPPASIWRGSVPSEAQRPAR